MVRLMQDEEGSYLARFGHCDLWHREAFGPASWSLPFGPRPLVLDFSWEWRRGEIWAILGSNESGKIAIAHALLGQGAVRPREPGGFYQNEFLSNGRGGAILSFEEAEGAVRYSLRFDDSDFVDGGYHPGLTVEQYLGMEGSVRAPRYSQEPGLRDLWSHLGLEPIRHRGLKFLSTGELRKTLLFRALLSSPSLLICEDLWEGLDPLSRREVETFFRRLAEGGRVGLPSALPDSREEGREPSCPSLLFLCDREDQVPPFVTHVLRVEGGEVKGQATWPGPKGEFLDQARRSEGHILALSEEKPENPGGGKGREKTESDVPPLIRMRNLRVAYQDRIVFEGFDFDLYPGEHCFIQGPNGCGKSTLVKLLTGHHPQGWANEISVCGIQWKPGEGIQALRWQSSLVSHELHRAFLALEDLSTLEVVLSGFFNTIGLYEPVGEEKKAEAEEALLLCGIRGEGKTLFRDLPWGIQRLALAARALVRRPPLIVLDEPCTGLDEEHRQLLLSALEGIAAEPGHIGDSTILMVSHDPKERLSCTQVDVAFELWGYGEDGQPRYGWRVKRTRP